MPQGPNAPAEVAAVVVEAPDGGVEVSCTFNDTSRSMSAVASSIAPRSGRAVTAVVAVAPWPAAAVFAAAVEAGAAVVAAADAAAVVKADRLAFAALSAAGAAADCSARSPGVVVAAAAAAVVAPPPAARVARGAAVLAF